MLCILISGECVQLAAQIQPEGLGHRAGALIVDPNSVAPWRIDTNLPPGKTIGYHYDGSSARRQFGYLVESFVSDRFRAAFRAAILEELEKAGYKVVPSSAYYGLSDTCVARFLVSAVITDLKLNTYGQLAGDSTEYSLLLKWQVLDRLPAKEVIEGVEGGRLRFRGNRFDTSSAALRQSFQRFVARSEFIARMQETSARKPSTEKKDSVRFFGTGTTSIQSVADIEPLLDAVFLVETPKGHGSGFLINSDGYALTCDHVVSSTFMLEAVLRGGKRVSANIVRRFPEVDIALIKLLGTGCPYLGLKSWVDAKVGGEVFAIGTPLSSELTHTISKGIYSARRIWQCVRIVQTDASVNPGESGGPLLTSDGRAIGVISFKARTAFGVEGIGFGIATDEAMDHLLSATVEMEKK